jgi:trimeric autotransporter adhesin
VTGAKMADGEIVRSINALRDDVTLAAGTHVGITPAGNQLTIAAQGSSLNVANTLVQRDSIGSFAAGPLLLSGRINQTSDDGLVAKGTWGTGGIPATGGGTRLMWYPAKAAFRAGQVTATEWNDSSVGQFSTAMGYNTIAGGEGSIATGYNTIASGGFSTASGFSTMATGQGSTAMGFYAVANGAYSTALGHATEASGTDSTAMGVETRAIGDYSTAIGSNTLASGAYSVAMGRYAATSDSTGTPRLGTFVWGDASTATMVRPTSWNQFVARASGGVIFYSNGAMTTGVTLAAGGGSWASVSDRERKRDFAPVDGDHILARLAALPVTSWSYRDDPSGRRYIGPVAQDFHALFALGDDTTIATLDVDGVTLAAVQALEQRSRDLEERYRREHARLERENATLRERLDRENAALREGFERENAALRERLDRRDAELDDLRSAVSELSRLSGR